MYLVPGLISPNKFPRPQAGRLDTGSGSPQHPHPIQGPWPSLRQLPTRTPWVFLASSQYLEILEPMKCVTVPQTQRMKTPSPSGPACSSVSCPVVLVGVSIRPCGLCWAGSSERAHRHSSVLLRH